MSAPSFGGQMKVLARRSVARTLRQPVVIGPTLVFPLFFLALNATALKAATRLPHFPTRSYLTFALASTFVLVGLSTVTISGGGIAEDIKTGFLDRLSLTPLRAAALVLGQLAGTAVIVAIGAVLYIVVAVIAGATIKTGVPGAVVVVLLAVLIAVSFASIGVLAAIASGSGNAVQAVFPLLFVLLFLSSNILPRNLIAHGWFRTVATYNPMSYFVEAPRSLIIKGWDVQALALGIGLALAVLVGTASVSSRQLRGKVRR